MDRNVALDGLRALAAVLVILFHATNTRFVGGWIGVDIFFVLSGYLITSILAREFETTGRISLTSFYLRRTLRLAPALIVLLVVDFGLAIALGEKPNEHAMQTAAALFYAMNWLRAFEVPMESNIDHTWSLSVEEQFYLVWPLILLLALAWGGRRVALVTALGLLAGVVGWRFHLAIEGTSVHRLYNGFDTRADALLGGVILALVRVRADIREALATLWPVPLFALALCAMCLPWHAPQTHRYGFVIIFFCAAWIVLALTAEAPNGLKQALSRRPVVFLGTISYGMYLWHAFFTSIFITIGVPMNFTLIVIFPITIAAASASYFFVERRFTRLRLGWTPRPAWAG